MLSKSERCYLDGVNYKGHWQRTARIDLISKMNFRYFASQGTSRSGNYKTKLY